jgi:hypothetical protein
VICRDQWRFIREMRGEQYDKYQQTKSQKSMDCHGGGSSAVVKAEEEE